MSALCTAARLDGIRVLVVEDVPPVREVVVDALEQYGAIVTAVPCAVEGLRLLQQERPHAFLTSLSMPGEDGYWLIRQVRSLPREHDRTTPAVAFTGQTTEEDRLDVLRAGFQAHVPKPVDLGRLIEIVAGLALEAATR